MVQSRDEVMALLGRFGKAFNRSDVDEILACVTDDFVWILAAGPDAPDGRICRGAEQVRDAMAARAALVRDVRFSETSVHFADERIIGTFRATGTYVADGAPYDVRGVDIYLLRDRLIASKDSYAKQIA
jgi:ketosteroid isomerase-like protein